MGQGKRGVVVILTDVQWNVSETIPPRYDSARDSVPNRNVGYLISMKRNEQIKSITK